jgi:hypothetical protein
MTSYSQNFGGFIFSDPNQQQQPQLSPGGNSSNMYSTGDGSNNGSQQMNQQQHHHQQQQQLPNGGYVSTPQHQQQQQGCGGQIMMQNQGTNAYASNQTGFAQGGVMNTNFNDLQQQQLQLQAQLQANLLQQQQAQQQAQSSGFSLGMLNPLNFFSGSTTNVNPVNGSANNLLNNNNISNNMGVFQQNTSMSPQLSSFNINQFGSPSPNPLAFMTPNMTPAPPTPQPMRTPMGGTPIPNPLAVQAAAALMQTNNGAGFGQVSAPPFGESVAAVNHPPQPSYDTVSVSTKVVATNAMPPSAAAALVSKSFFRRGISSVGSALGIVANYINESLLSGIPFHIADRAMRESKETYAKWWEGGINDSNENDDDTTRVGDDGDRSIADDDTWVAGNKEPAEKKRKLDEDNHAVGVYKRGSALSVSLERNYNDMGIDTTQSHLNHKESKRLGDERQSTPQPQPMEVDSSIIKPRRSQFEHKKKPADVGGDSSGYGMFNNVGSMYGNDMYSAAAAGTARNNGVEINRSAGTSTNISSPSKSTNSYSSYDAIGSYYTNEDNDDKEPEHVPATTATISVNENSTTITSSNTLDDTLRAIQEMIQEKNNASEEGEIYTMSSNPRNWVTKTIRSELIDALQSVQGDITDKRFLSSLEVLSRFYKASGRDARVNPWSGRKVSDDSTYDYGGGDVGGPIAGDLLEGSWVNMSRPNYVECLGKNDEGDFMYTLGRMSFDMFQPGNLICSVQSTHNNIRIVGEKEELPKDVPSSLKEEVALLSNSECDSSAKRPLLRSYDIAVSMTLEPLESVGQAEPPSATPSPTKRMRAIMAVRGYILPDPDVPNRLTVWFTGGKLCPAKLANQDGAETDDEDDDKCEMKHSASEEDGYGGFEEWTALFSKGKWRKTLGERARAMAAKLLLGADIPNKMEEEGQMEYHLHRPIGGHSKIYIDVSNGCV